jgi:competence protein ComGC
MQHGMQVICILLILCVLQFCKNKKLMQVQKMACRSGKNVVNLQSQLRIWNQEPRI